MTSGITKHLLLLLLLPLLLCIESADVFPFLFYSYAALCFPKVYDPKTLRYDQPYATGNCAGEGTCGTCFVEVGVGRSRREAFGRCVRTSFLSGGFNFYRYDALFDRASSGRNSGTIWERLDRSLLPNYFPHGPSAG